mgnify:CR=1 FL=1
MRILIFDSGLGGLTVHDPVRAARPDAEILYLADDAVFPYGGLDEDVLVARVLDVVLPVAAQFAPDIVVIACNTASTLVLPHLRARLTQPVVGTVPAIKPAAERSQSRLISVLATPGTVRRDYTHDLVARYAGDCAVTLVGCRHLATLAEAALHGEQPADADILAEIAPAFVESDGRRTDFVVLACTHYPLLMDRLTALAPWPVTMIDPGPAIARRVVQLAGPAVDGAQTGGGTALFSSGRAPSPALAAALAARGLSTAALPVSAPSRG